MAIRIRHSDELPDEAHEINVTPFIDVMLVLLIVFMVAAPLATVDIPVDLPSSSTPSQQQPPPQAPVFLTLQADHRLVLGDAVVTNAGLGPAIDAVTHGSKDRRVYLRVDKSVNYDTLMRTIDALRAAGYLRVALVGSERDATR